MLIDKKEERRKKRSEVRARSIVEGVGRAFNTRHRIQEDYIRESVVME